MYCGWTLGSWDSLVKAKGMGFVHTLSLGFLIGSVVKGIAFLETCPFLSKCIWKRGSWVGERGGMKRRENVVGMYWMREESLFNDNNNQNPLTQRLNIEFSRETFLFSSSKKETLMWELLFLRCCLWNGHVPFWHWLAERVSLAVVARFY